MADRFFCSLSLSMAIHLVLSFMKLMLFVKTIILLGVFVNLLIKIRLEAKAEHTYPIADILFICY